METEHTGSVVEKAVAYVKDMFGIAPGEKAPDGESPPVTPMTAREASLTSDDAMRLDPHAYTFKTVGELNAESARREDGE